MEMGGHSAMLEARYDVAVADPYGRLRDLTTFCRHGWNARFLHPWQV